MKDYWDKTQVGDIFTAFAGQIGEFTRSIQSQGLIRIENHIGDIFFRWRHLCQQEYLYTPSQEAEKYRIAENWPNDMQFFPQATMRFVLHKALIDVKIDTITFEGQPLISDAKRALKNLPSTFTYGEKYQKDIQAMCPIIRKFPIDASQQVNTHSAWIKSYLENNLTLWYVSSTAIQKSMTLAQWITIWRRIIKDICQGKEFAVDAFSESIIHKIRQNIPNYGLTIDELENVETAPYEQILQFYELHFGLRDYFMIPLCQYLNLISPVYTDVSAFYHDVTDFLESGDVDSLYAPPTLFIATHFGRQSLNL